MFIFSIGLNAQDIGSKDIENKVNQLISELTLEEKASLCSGRDAWSTKPIERLNIPWIWMADGPHGLRRAPATDKWGYGDQHPATCFPTASALAASWDIDLIYRVGQAIGGECQALSVNVLLGPGVNIKRSLLGGRNFEFFSEDPVLSGELGAAFINGVQSQGVGTSLKHYVANNVETNRMHINSALDTRTLHEIYLHPFEIAVKKAQPWTVMACYNRVQGIYGTESPYLLTEILKNRWGFEGIVISDWEAVVDRVEGIRSGMHIQMPGQFNTVTDRQIVEAVNNGSLNESKLDQIVKDILKVVLTAKSTQKEGVELNVEGNHAFARQVAAESITLLKNEHNVLPINTDKYKTVAIIGEFAVAPRYQGNGSSEVKPSKLDETLKTIKQTYGNNIEIKYAQGYSLKDDDDFSMINEAKNMAKVADIALVFAGLPLHYESEGIDRKHIDLPASHNKLISEVASVQKNAVVVLTNGSAVAMPWIEEVDGILETWLPGQAGAGAISDVLFGKVNPSGKIAETFPVKLEDSPAFINFPGEEGDVLYGERMFVGYRHYDKRKIEPLFPFGHGLSYTTFEYKDLQVSSENPTDSEGLKVSCIIKNTGNIKGKEIVQLYISDPESRLQRPVKELKKFTKIELAPGESKIVEFDLESRDFSYFNSRLEQWIAESGKYIIKIGASSDDIRFSKTINLNSTQRIPLGFDEYTFFREYWNNPQTRVLLKELVPNWIKFFTPEGKTTDEAQFQDFLIDQPMIKFPFLSQGEVSESQIMEFVERCKEFTWTP
jgi:beta-glucosidase